jgi:hypothetical protein
MTDRTPEEEKLHQDTRKVMLECAALERNAKTDTLKTVLALLAAFAFVFSFACDRYKVSEQRTHDRKVAVATEFDNLNSKTLSALTVARPNTLFMRLNVETYKGKLEELGKRTRSLPENRELSAFLSESVGFADQFLKDYPPSFEFTQWTTAIEAEAVWASRTNSLTPDFDSLFGKDLSLKWAGLRQMALSALREKFSLLGDTEPKVVTAFREAADSFQRSLQQAVR